MKDYKNIKAPFFPKGDIAIHAHKVREEYIGNQIPVDVLSFAKKFGIKVYPKDLREYDMEASYNSRENSIDVDTRIFEASCDYRFRFSVAHELGHALLHRDFYEENMNFQTIEEYIDFFTTVDQRQYDFLEMHANEFAGAFLVPKDTLRDEFLRRCTLPFEDITDKEDQVDSIANDLKGIFGVSAFVIKKRLKFEGIIDEIK